MQKPDMKVIDTDAWTVLKAMGQGCSPCEHHMYNKCPAAHLLQEGGVPRAQHTGVEHHAAPLRRERRVHGRLWGIPGLSKG